MFKKERGNIMMKESIITYTINKVINNQFYISIENGEVVVKAPWYLTRKEIQEIVEAKKKWIQKKVKDSKNNKTEDIITILGKKYNVELICKNVKKPEIKKEKEMIKMILPNKYKNENKQELVNILIKKLYSTIAEKEIELIMEKTRLMLKYAPEDYSIEEMKSISKCTKDGKIIINPEIIKYDKEIIEYIILHEFVHLKYKTNSKGFNKMMIEYMPNYKKYQSIVENRK